MEPNDWIKWYIILVNSSFIVDYMIVIPTKEFSQKVMQTLDRDNDGIISLVE